MDTGATASAISEVKAKQLGLKIFPTKHKLVQVDESYLEVCGEIHTQFYRDSLEFKFSALVVRKMGFDIIGGTNFHKENDVYCRLKTNKIVVKGIYSFNSTPYVATLNKLKVISEEKPVLIKCIRSESLLPGESQKIQISGKRFEDGDVVEVEPRIEGPKDFPKHHLQTVDDN